ncbi:protein FAR1-RELATED SEQUENCE 5-like [Prosopis cineraria]|uniref:protein FAR1-RELATED SEQUENCE 5-like n=1 Tax=Prosopis cineraria TaxID=364024 RepID=UPI0024104CAA|nr:protein FAR1-RELATED SEQUENCE 5-like [Prosopis cineraria]XP_054790043.1 protein FAR1-RELATED SEQUENCE 5-like [Prosopis cineraria]XP_054790044.1 protein FAR1-RELATED SEQUENCE 5-like [Prosopis cineraria]XP_054790045.1 protein FAR1-RELATED SEQUENCE 5-like [Prosopis cineraria]
MMCKMKVKHLEQQLTPEQSQSPRASSIADCDMVFDTENERASPNIGPVDQTHMGNNDDCLNSSISCDNNFQIDAANGNLSQEFNISSVDVSSNSNVITAEEELCMIPKIGMEFDSEDHAYKYYSRYAVLKGFSIRKDFVNKSRVNGAVVSRRYTCYRQGYGPNKHSANVRKSHLETRTGCLAHMTIARQPNGKFHVTHFEAGHNHEFATPCTAYMLPSQRRLSFAQAVESNLSNNSVLDGVPKLGMGFDSEDHAYDFYNTYAGRVGFSVRKDYVNRSKIDGAVASRRFTCFREGFRQKDKRDMTVKRPRKETRIGCLAQLVISRQPDGRYCVTHFEEKHNHELVAACRVHMLRSQKRIATNQAIESNMLDGSKVHPKSGPNCKAIKGLDDTGCDPIEYGNKLPFKHTREMKEGEIEKLKHHFRSKRSKNPSFFYAFQRDSSDQITNMFWADTKMVGDYCDFGDVVCFDCSYRFCRDSRPFAPFLGVNNHKQMVIFGAALLYDETVESFKWLFQVFLEAMSRRQPKTILIDQDEIIAEAVSSVLLETNCQICAWHVYQNTLNQLSHLSVGSNSFVNDLRSCFFDHEEEEGLVNAWNDFLNRYNLWKNEWLCRIYESRDNWAPAYGRQNFCADITSLLWKENLIGSLKKHLTNDTDVISFLKHLGKVVTDWHYKELEANYDMSLRMPALMGDVILLKHARDPYTPKIFELFQKEYETCLNLVIKHCSESGSLYKYKVSLYEHVREYTVTFNSSNETVSCSCMKFESMGVLCSHALKVLDYRNIRILPSLYILKRWTKDASFLRQT